MMDYFANLGIIVCFAVAPIVPQVFVNVERDVVVKPTPNPLKDVSQRVDVQLNCTGSRSDMFYYIENKISWYHIRSNESKLQLTDGFYTADEAKELFYGDDARYTFTNGSDDDGYKFVIKIAGVTYSDNGIFRFMLLDVNTTVIDYDDATITVVSPVQGVAIELHDMKHTVLARSAVPLPKDATPTLTVPPGQYMIKCDCYGSNPAPTLKVLYNNNTLKSTVVAVQSQLDNRVSYNASISIMNQTITPYYAAQIIKCSANIPGDFYPKMDSGISLMVQNTQTELPPEVTTGVTSAVTKDVFNNTPSNSFVSSVGVFLSVSIISLMKILF